MPSSIPLHGVIPITPTPFTENDLDLTGQRRVLDCMIDQRADGICPGKPIPSSLRSPMWSATSCSICAWAVPSAGCREALTVSEWYSKIFHVAVS
jgi:hypothetical protein